METPPSPSKSQDFNVLSASSASRGPRQLTFPSPDVPMPDASNVFHCTIVDPDVSPEEYKRLAQEARLQNYTYFTGEATPPPFVQAPPVPNPAGFNRPLSRRVARLLWPAKPKVVVSPPKNESS